MLSVRQPWAWFMFAEPPLLPVEVPPKDIENRTWYTPHRGPILIHASLQWDASAVKWVQQVFGYRQPSFEARLGGIVGSIIVVDCVQSHKSKWFQGPYGFVLRDPYPLPFEPCSGKLGLWTK